MKTYTLTMRIEAEDDVTVDQMRTEIYDACEDVPFGFDIKTVVEES